MSTEAYKTEIFGPVLCVLNVDTMDEAINIMGLLAASRAGACSCK